MILLSKIYTELGIDFTFPLKIKNPNGYPTYYEDSNGYWEKYERDSNGNRTYYEDSDGYWEKYEYDSNGKQTYYEDGHGFWEKRERDSNGNTTYRENSNGRSSGTIKPIKQIEIDGIKYNLTPAE